MAEKVTVARVLLLENERGGEGHGSLASIYRDSRISDRVNEGAPGPASDSYDTTGDDGLGLTDEGHDGLGNGFRVTLVGAVAGCLASIRFLTVAGSLQWEPRQSVMMIG